jgi:hypothetical protein
LRAERQAAEQALDYISKLAEVFFATQEVAESKRKSNSLTAFQLLKKEPQVFSIKVILVIHMF